MPNHSLTKVSILLATLSTLVTAQQYGVGFGKATWSTSNAAGCYKWLMSYLPTVEDDPTGELGCGEVGRTRVATSAGRTGRGNGFGLHSVHANASSPRTHADVCPTQEHIEDYDDFAMPATEDDEDGDADGNPEAEEPWQAEDWSDDAWHDDGWTDDAGYDDG